MADDLQALRAVAMRLAERAKTDPTFKEQIERDPVKTLTAAGLPEKAVPAFLRETGMGDVVGYICLETCNIISL